MGVNQDKGKCTIYINSRTTTSPSDIRDPNEDNRRKWEVIVSLRRVT